MSDILKPCVGVSVVVLKEGKVLLGKRKNAHGDGFYATPGGHLEFLETVEACAVRELMEETGLIANSLKLGPWTQNIFEHHKHYVTLFVFVTDFVGDPKLLEPDKCENWNWYDWDKLPEPLFPTIRSLVNEKKDEELKSLMASSNPVVCKVSL